MTLLDSIKDKLEGRVPWMKQFRLLQEHLPHLADLISEGSAIISVDLVQEAVHGATKDKGVTVEFGDRTMTSASWLGSYWPCS
jgi:hypothetical protein